MNRTGGAPGRKVPGLGSSRRAVARLFLRLGVGLGVGFVVTLAGCRRGAGPGAEERVVVFAAASLRDAFTGLAAGFERRHPGVTVTFNFAGTQELRAQLEHGASADVLASADALHMGELSRRGRVLEPVVFARNEPVVVLAKDPEGTPSGINVFSDLPRATRIVLGAPEVPIGHYTQMLLDRASRVLGPDFRAGVERKVVSRELSVRQVLAKVSLGEAEAGIVYRSDAIAARARVDLVMIPAEMNVVAEYPIAVVAGAVHPGLARAFVDLVRSSDGQRALERAGFTLPGPVGGPP